MNTLGGTTVAVAEREPIRRVRLAGARRDRLYFAQVREDPALELEALAPAPGGSYVIVSSGGCTALSLLAAGAGRVVGVDLNETQNDLTELKARAAATLRAAAASAFLGGAPAAGRTRASTYRGLRTGLSPGARAFWDARRSWIRRGVISVGVSERLIALVAGLARNLIQGRRRVARMLACETLEEQRALYEREWDTRRWRALFPLLLNRAVFDRAYDPRFFAHVQTPSFAEHFRERVEHTLTRIPTRDNYFLHQMLTGRYPLSVPGGLPPYLAAAGSLRMKDAASRLTLVDGALTEYLRGEPAGSVDGFAISNVCEWLNARAIDELFGEIVRTARPGARLCFRNFVGWTEVPERWRSVVVEDRSRGDALMARDRSVVQRRFALCMVAG